MTTPTEQTLLNRIAAFDKTPREFRVEAGVEVITYNSSTGWLIERTLEIGDLLHIGEGLIPVTASRSELTGILGDIPTPQPPGQPMDLRDLNDTLVLIVQAQNLLGPGQGRPTVSQQDVDSALWRLVDAAGLLSKIATPKSVGSKVQPTERGFFIDQTTFAKLRQ